MSKTENFICSVCGCAYRQEGRKTIKLNPESKVCYVSVCNSCKKEVRQEAENNAPENVRLLRKKKELLKKAEERYRHIKTENTKHGLKVSIWNLKQEVRLLESQLTK